MNDKGISPKAASLLAEASQSFRFPDTCWIERLLSSVAQLDWSSQEVIADIVSRMYHCEMSRYPAGISAALGDFAASGQLDGCDRVVVVPVRKDTDYDTKSGEFVAYMVKSRRLVEKVTSNVRVQHRARLDGFKRREGDHLLWVDDYIGSGRSIDTAIGNLSPEWRREEMSVCTIVCHDIGKKRLEDDQIRVFASLVRHRSISDHDDPDFDKDGAIERMEHFAKEYEVSSKYKLGLGQCEANDVMERIPNNSLPFLWHQGTSISGKNVWNPPFRRH